MQAGIPRRLSKGEPNTTPGCTRAGARQNRVLGRPHRGSAERCVGARWLQRTDRTMPTIGPTPSGRRRLRR
eukprot:680893-Lingulodinium_polyedra.AAC.1